MSERANGRNGRLPTFLVIGAQKSATTSAIRTLGRHPSVFALPREVHFFDRHYDRGIDWYRQRFAGAGGRPVVGESSPSYMYVEPAAERIARHLPRAHLVAILRNPVDRAYSHYWHNRTRGREDLEFREAIAAEPDRLAAGDPDVRARYSYLDRGRYLAQLRRMGEHFPRESLFVLLFEDLRDDPVTSMGSLYRFLGVEGTVIPPVAVKNRFMTFRSSRLRPSIRRLPGPLRKAAARLNVRYGPYPPMPANIRGLLKERFREENGALARWLGRDLSAWG
jgi:hypothetical protein